MKLLLEEGADLEIEDDFNSATPLLWAVVQDHEEAVKLVHYQMGHQHAPHYDTKC